SAVSGRHGAHLGAKQLHAEYVRLLPPHVGGAHIDETGIAETGGYGGRGHAMLAGTGFGDDARLAHALCQQDLPQAIVDLVRARMIQVLSLEIDPGAADMPGEAFREIEL